MFIKILNIISLVALVTIGILKPSFGVALIWIFGILLALFMGIHIYSYGGIYLDGIKLKRILKKKSRLMMLDQAKQEMSQGHGSIIIELPTLGWNVVRLWWSPDDTVLQSDIEPSNDDLVTDVDCKNYDNYISEESGIAKLVDVFIILQRHKEYLIRNFGHCNCFYIFSAGVALKRMNVKSLEEEGRSGEC